MKILEHWKHETIKHTVEEFLELYENRPIKNNEGGMKIPHMLNAWFVIKKMKPKFIIESGVWKGLGTWFFNQASPESQIICIDPDVTPRIYTDKNAKYYTKDFSLLNLDIDTENTLVFFDDHQNSIERIKQCVEKKFKTLMFEDNYPFDKGDCYSIKKVLSKKDYILDKIGNKSWHKHNKEDFNFLIENVKIYQEMPPMFLPEKTRWDSDWNNYETPEQLLTKEEFLPYAKYLDEMKDYTWICYLELK